MNKFLAGLVGFGVMLGAGAFYVQHEAIVELRSELTALRTEVQMAAKQHEAAQREAAKAPAVAVVTSENAPAEDSRAELTKLRDEVAALQKSTQEIARVVQSAGQSTVPVKLIPASEWKNAGRATTAAAVETLLWAGAGGDVETMANAIVLDPTARAKAEAMFARLPDATRADYGSPEKLVALFLAKDAAAVTGMQILGQRDITPDVVGVRVRVANDEGKMKEQGFGFQKTGDGLRLVVTDQIVDKYAQQLAGGPAPAARSGSK